jgi:hypothetical protein
VAAERQGEGTMSDENKRNIFYFEGPSMRALYEHMQKWQEENNKRFLSVSIQKDGDAFCCIALTNPTEVVITDKEGKEYVDVRHGCLQAKTY